MIQGILTGIGFLGAGVIFKQGFFNVAGLTTAASLWFTAALGIIFGLGFYYPAVLATFAALFTLATLRWLEWRVMRQCFARLTLCFAKGHIMSQDELERILAELGFTIHQVDYRQTGEWGDVRIQDGRLRPQKLQGSALFRGGRDVFPPTGSIACYLSWSPRFLRS